MKVCVYGLWHLGTVTAACLASAGHDVVGLDPDPAVIDGLRAGRPPLFEPGLADLLAQSPSLRFTTELQEAVKGAEVVWITFDTPVDEDDNADVDTVVHRVGELFPHLDPGTLVLVSSQFPVGSIRRLEDSCPDKRISFACSPENLRLGKAIQVFTQPDRVIIGVRRDEDRARIEALFQAWRPRIEWMSVESAEMTKHAVNAFLATSVAFINELGILCERVGADAKEVERGLKSEARIGPKAYLSPGAAFAGGTLARDIGFLTGIGAREGVATPLLAGVKASNDGHRQWAQRKLEELFGSLSGRSIAVWGLTYKPGTDTLRRSSSVELCEWLAVRGASVRAHDPAVKSLPEGIRDRVLLVPSPAEAGAGADVLVVATEWPEYRSISVDALFPVMKRPLVLDPGRFLASTFGLDPRIQYITVGRPTAHVS